jgi:hypothetical protein
VSISIPVLLLHAHEVFHLISSFEFLCTLDVKEKLVFLGGTPYPAMSVSEVNEFLQKGKRMDPPVHCPQEM